MPARPDLSRKIDSKTFRSFYYLKEELVAFCRENGFSTSGSKIELTDRIAHFLDTGEVKTVKRKVVQCKNVNVGNITIGTKIEENFVCSEKHRAFFKEHIGNSFSFNV
jgi:hypothetical protein